MEEVGKQNKGDQLQAALQHDVASEGKRNDQDDTQGKRQYGQRDGPDPKPDLLPALLRIFCQLKQPDDGKAKSQRQENIVRNSFLPKEAEGDHVADLHQDRRDPKPPAIASSGFRMEETVHHQPRKQRRDKPCDQMRHTGEARGKAQPCVVQHHKYQRDVFQL